MDKSARSEKDGTNAFVSISIYKIKLSLTRPANCYYTISWKDKSFDSQNVVNSQASQQPTWLNLRHTITPTKVECWPSAADELQQDQLQPGRTIFIKVYERGSGGLFGGDSLIGEAHIPLGKFVFIHSRDDSLGVTASLMKKDASRGDVTVFAEATGVNAVIDALSSAYSSESQVPKLFGWACETLTNLSKQNKLKFQQYASAEMLDSLSNVTLAAFAAPPVSTEKKREKEKSKSKDKSSSRKQTTIKLDEKQRSQLSALWKSMVEQELRKSLISNGLFGHLNKFLDPLKSNEDLLLLALDLCKPFFTVSSHQKELIAQGVAARMVRLVESTSISGAELPVPVADRVRSKSLDCLLYFDTPLHSDLVDLGLGRALVALIALKTIPSQLRLRCLELLSSLDGKQQSKMAQAEEKDRETNPTASTSGGATGSAPSLVGNLLELLQDQSQPSLQLKALTYLNSSLATQDSALEALLKKGILTHIVRLLSQSSTPTTAAHVTQLRSLATEIIKKIQPRYGHKLCFETSFVRDLAILLFISETLAIQLIELFINIPEPNEEQQKQRDALLLSKGLAPFGSEPTELPEAPKVPILRICIEKLLRDGVKLSEEKLVELGLPSSMLQFFPFESTETTVVDFKLLISWRILPRDIEAAGAWAVLTSIVVPQPLFYHDMLLPLLDWFQSQDWTDVDHQSLALKTAPGLLSLFSAEPSMEDEEISKPSSVTIKFEEVQSEMEEYNPQMIEADTWEPVVLEPLLIDSANLPKPPEHSNQLRLDPSPTSPSLSEPARGLVPLKAPRVMPALTLGVANLLPVLKLLISWGALLKKTSDWKLVSSFLAVLVANEQVRSTANATLIGLLVPSKPRSDVDPPLYADFIELLKSQPDFVVLQLFEILRVGNYAQYASRLFKSVLMHQEILKPALRSFIMTSLVSFIADPTSAQRRKKATSIFKKIPDWEQLVLEDQALLKLLLSTAIKPVVKSSASSVFPCTQIIRNIIAPIWTKTSSMTLLSSDMVAAVTSVFTDAHDSASAAFSEAIQRDKTYFDYFSELFNILEWDPSIPLLLSPTPETNTCLMSPLVLALFPKGSPAVQVLEPLRLRCFTFLQKVLANSDDADIKSLCSPGGALAHVGAYLLTVPLRHSSDSAAISQALVCAEQMNQRVKTPSEDGAKRCRYCVRSFFASEKGFWPFVGPALKTKRFELVSMFLEGLALLETNTPTQGEVESLLSIGSDSALLSALSETDLHHFQLVLKNEIEAEQWMTEGSEIFSSAPPSLDTVLRKERQKLLSKIVAPKKESVAVEQAVVAETESAPAPPSSSSSSSNSTQAGVANNENEAVTEETMTTYPRAFQQFNLNVITTWFGSAGFNSDKIGWVPLFSSSKDGLINSSLLSAIAGKTNIMVVIRTRGGWSFGGFSTKGVPDSVKTSTIAGSVRDVSGFIFCLKRPAGPPQPQKFSIRYSEANNAINYHQGKFALGFGRNDIAINLDSAVEKVKISDSGTFSYLIPANLANKSFFTGSAYVDFEELLVYQVVDRTTWKGRTETFRAETVQVSVAEPPLLVPAPVKQEVKQEKCNVILMDRRLSAAIQDILGPRLPSSPHPIKWRLISSHTVPGITSTALTTAITGTDISPSATVYGPRIIVFKCSSGAVFGLMLSTNLKSTSNGWISDPGSCFFSVIHTTPQHDTNSVVASKLLLPALSSDQGHFFVGQNVFTAGASADFYLDLMTGQAHSNPGIAFNLPKSFEFQSPEAHALLSGSPRTFMVTSIESWAICPQDLLPASQRPTLPLLRSLFSLLLSKQLASQKAWYAKVSRTVAEIADSISRLSHRRAQQVEEELLRLHDLSPNNPIVDDQDELPEGSVRPQDSMPWKSPILRLLLQMKFPGMSVLPFSVESPNNEKARHLTSSDQAPNVDSEDDSSQSEASDEIPFMDQTFVLTNTNSSNKFVTHLLLESELRKFNVTAYVLRGDATLQEEEEYATIPEMALEALSAMAESWYRAHGSASKLAFSLRGRADEAGDAISEEAELSATMKSPIYDVLPQLNSLSQSQTLLQAQPPKASEYELPNFVTGAQVAGYLSVSDDDESFAPSSHHVIALPFALPADKIVLKVKYAAAKPLETAGLSQIVVVGYDPADNQQVVPPLPQNVADVSTTFIAPRSRPRKNLKKMQRTFSFASEGDSNGVLFTLGTSDEPEDVVDSKVERLETSWKNPVTSGVVKFTVSHGYYNKANMNNSVATARPGDGAPTTCFWGGSAPVWFILDLKSWKLQMSHFTLRHGYHYDNSFPTDVVMYGANPEGDRDPADSDWVELWAYKDPIFERSFQIRTFPVKQFDTHFRCFKFLQKGNYTMGKSAAPGAPFLPISGLEIYGHLKYEPQEETDSALSL